MTRSNLSIYTDKPVNDIPNPVSFDFWLHESRLENYEYSTSIEGTVEPTTFTIQELIPLIGKPATARIEISTQLRFGQWRVALQTVEPQNGALIFAITNTAPDKKSLIPPVFGDCEAIKSCDSFSINW